MYYVLYTIYPRQRHDSAKITLTTQTLVMVRVESFKRRRNNEEQLQTKAAANRAGTETQPQRPPSLRYERRGRIYVAARQPAAPQSERCIMNYVLCMYFVPCTMNYVLCNMYYVLDSMYYVVCTMYYVLSSSKSPRQAQDSIKRAQDGYFGLS